MPDLEGMQSEEGVAAMFAASKKEGEKLGEAARAQIAGETAQIGVESMKKFELALKLAAEDGVDVSNWKLDSITRAKLSEFKSEFEAYITKAGAQIASQFTYDD